MGEDRAWGFTGGPLSGGRRVKAKDEDGSAVCPWDVAFSPGPLVSPSQMAEHVEGVRVVCEQPLHVQSEDRRMKYRWNFRVYSQVRPALCSGRR